MVTVTVPPGATDAVSNNLVALAPSDAADPAVTVTLAAPPTSWSALSESLSVPEKLWVPAVSEAVTV